MAITIRSSFLVDAAPEQTWRSLVDIEFSAPCFPGAQLKEKLPDGSYKGAFTVKLGPLTFNFAGKFKLAEQDDAARTAVVTASGTDTKGRGGAEAKINVQVLDADGKSRVEVVSEVNLSGTVAQYGRGVSMIEALSQQLLNQFAKNLTKQIEAESAYVAPEASSTSAPTPSAQPQAAATSTSTSTSTTPKPPPATRRVPAPAPEAAPLDAGALMRQALWQSIRNFFARLFGAGKKP
jgi:carbon monoxide dehydrogenase subunit G